MKFPSKSFFKTWMLAFGGAFLLIPNVYSKEINNEKASISAPPKVDHILLEVKDLNRSVRFYKDELGLRQKSRSGDFVTLEAANIGVFLWSQHWDWSPTVEEGKRPPQGMYPHFVIPDVKGVMAKLQKDGYKIIAPAKTYNYGTEAFVADPDGFVWALISK